MQILLGTVPCLRRETERDNLRRLGLPIPDEFHWANTILSPLGEDAARGWLLLERADVDALDLNAVHDVILIDESIENTEVRRLTLKNMVIVSARCVVPNVEGQIDAAYLVEVADQRHLVRNVLFEKPANYSYNVRAPGWGGDYYEDSTNSGTAWTWAEMIEDLWGFVSAQLGTFPGMPFTPDGTPEGWKFPGVSAWGALCYVLRRIGCAVRWKVTPSDDLKTATAESYEIVRVGSNADAEEPLTFLTAAEEEKTSRLIFNADYREPVKGKIPYGVRVFFNRMEEHRGTERETAQDSNQWAMLTPYSVDVVGPDSADAEPGVYHPVWDDLPAIYDATGSLTNGSALNTRATERADNYYDTMRDPGGSRLHKIYSGLVLVGPASVISGVRWGEGQFHHYGLQTEVRRVPGGELRVTAQGQWDECTRSTPDQSPDFGPTWPVYPGLAQVLYVLSLTPTTGNMYPALVQYADPSGWPATTTWQSGESVWAVESSELEELSAAGPFVGRLVGFFLNKPVYFFRADCCDNTTIDQDCCPGYEVPHQLCVLIEAPTIPEIDGIQFDINYEALGSGSFWRGRYQDDTETVNLGLVCTQANSWQIGAGNWVSTSGPVGGNITGCSATTTECDPVVLVFECTLAGEDITITITEPPCTGSGSGGGADCSYCNTGAAPATWTGTPSGFTGNCADLDQAWTWTQNPSYSCEWLADDGFDNTSILDIASQVPGLFFFIGGVLVATYFCNDWNGDCCDDMVMTLHSSTCDTAPATITLTSGC